MRKLFLSFFTFLLSVLAHPGFAQQVCPSGHTLNAPNSRYAVQADASQVKDNRTGLIWQRCSLGQTWSGTTCIGSATAMTWQLALTAATGSSGGFAWRVPNIKELSTLQELACYSPSINVTIFPATLTNGYWSSSTLVIYPNLAWHIDFNGGYDSYDFKTNSRYARLVRSSQ